MKIGGSTGGQQQYDVAVAQKIQQSTKTGGKQAVQLIDSALSSSQPPQGTGKSLNITA